MSRESERRSQEFLKISSQFKLGILTTEASHPLTSRLSEVAKVDTAAALELLFQVDEDVVRGYERFVLSNRAPGILQSVLETLRAGGRLIFTGCGSTGRLSIQLVSIWREFWQRYPGVPAAQAVERRAFSVMAGGDFALIKSVEGFEDYTAFGRKQMADLGVTGKDLVFAITEGGETSFVIGTAWQGVESGAKVYFIYNNPDEVLCRYVERSREVISDPRIIKLNLTTGPMAITGSTRMQATSIQLCVLLTVLEMAVRQLLPQVIPDEACMDSSAVPQTFLQELKEMHQELLSSPLRARLARLVELEERVYRKGGKVNYFADFLGIDLLTDTTERSPTYCTPPFRKADDPSAADSWAFLFLPQATTTGAWERILRREPECVHWSLADVQAMLDSASAARSFEVIQGISRTELLRFQIGLDGLPLRPLKAGDAMIGVASPADLEQVSDPKGWFGLQREAATQAGVASAAILLCNGIYARERLTGPDDLLVHVPSTGLLLNPVMRVGLKMLLNALSTCTMVRLGRVLGNYMVWVVPSNLKLIDRATRYIEQLSGLTYSDANRLLFEIIEYIEPRMQAGRAYPPAVAMAVLRAERGLNNEEAEKLVLDKI